MFCRLPRVGVRPLEVPLLRPKGLRAPDMLPPPMARLLALLALLAALGLVACGSDDDDGGDGSSPPPPTAEQTETEPSPSEQRAALEDTTVKPEIPRPSGSPPRRLEKED